MQVYSINGGLNGRNTSFTALKIDAQTLWDGEMVQEFVRNKEVQKFVKYWHDRGINIIAQGHGKSGISMAEDSSRSDRFFYGILSLNGGVKNFNAEEAITQILKEAKEKVDSIPLLKDAQEFVSKFNRALYINSALEKSE